MIHKFQINIRHQIKSFEKGLITFLLAFIGVIILGMFEVFDLNDFQSLFVLFMLTCLLFSLPAIFLHITYLSENWQSILIVDNTQRSVTVETRETNFIFKYEDIEHTELNVGIYYKNDVDNRGRRPAPWTNYGYVKLKLKDGREFLFTSLMVDLNKLPFPVTTTKFRLMPYLRKTPKRRN